jgi:DNA-binding protein Fis
VFRIRASGLRDIEREALEITLQITNYNQSAAARLLGISRPTLGAQTARVRAAQRVWRAS